VDTSVTEDEENDFEEKLFDLHFACVYANSLCTLAEMYYFNGQYETGVEHLTSAMKAIDLHEHDIRTHPVLGRILRDFAIIYMQGSQAVKAEGLFRSALQKFQSPYGQHDIRYQYEAALAKGYYGRLLTKWEKRESIGNQYRDEAKQVIDASYIQPSVPASPLQRYVFSSLFQFPHQ